MNQPLHRFKAEVFKALGHPLRIKILELLRAGEVSVSDLLRQLEVEPSTASQQLAVLRIRGIVESRREGNNVFYRLRDPSVGDLLDVARRMFNNHVVDLQQLLVAQEQEDRLVARQPRRGASRGAVGARS